MQLSSDSGKDEVFPKLSFSKGIRIREEKLDYLQTRISAYLIKISRSELNEQESQEVIALMNIVKTLESIGDFIGILEEKLAEKKRALKNDLSEEGKHDLMEMHKMVCLEVEQLVDALKNMDGAKAATLLQGDEQFKLRVAKAEAAHLKRVFLLPEAEVTHDIHMELLNRSIIIARALPALFSIQGCLESKNGLLFASLQRIYYLRPNNCSFVVTGAGLKAGE